MGKFAPVNAPRASQQDGRGRGEVQKSRFVAVDLSRRQKADDQLAVYQNAGNSKNCVRTRQS